MATAEYADLLASLYRLEAARGMDFKLERVALALKNLGDPQQRYPIVHIAGTNGKGSVAAMVHAVLGAAGYRAGLYTSPHLVSFTERIRIGASMIGPEEVVRLAQNVHAAATVRGIDLTFFEFVTVMAFLHFAQSRVDAAVVEVGLGGRLDATNVVDPDVAVVTTIGRDHEEFLGHTLASVASEKAGIIKPRKPVVIGNVTGEAAAVLARATAERGAVAYWLGHDFSIAGVPHARFRGIGLDVDALAIALRGAHQRDNAATAVAAIACLRERLPVSHTAIRAGLAGVRWPGRLEVVQAEPRVILDGAHNADGIAALLRELPAVADARKVHLLFAVMRDKQWQPMVDALGPRVVSAVVTTVLPPRGEAAAVLARAFAPHCPVRTAPDPMTGLERLLHTTPAHDAILVAGSLFLIGAVYPCFLSRRGGQHLFDPSDALLHL
jgi:dihydrofolate synthase/folylpolyglutamate synthase